MSTAERRQATATMYMPATSWNQPASYPLTTEAWQLTTSVGNSSPPRTLCCFVEPPFIKTSSYATVTHTVGMVTQLWNLVTGWPGALHVNLHGACSCWPLLSIHALLELWTDKEYNPKLYAQPDFVVHTSEGHTVMKSGDKLTSWELTQWNKMWAHGIFWRHQQAIHKSFSIQILFPPIR